MTIDTTEQLEMRWVPVTDSRGRTHMEATWVLPTQVVAHATTHAA